MKAVVREEIKSIGGDFGKAASDLFKGLGGKKKN
jgi:hypothetical protein